MPALHPQKRRDGLVMAIDYSLKRWSVLLATPIKEPAIDDNRIEGRGQPHDAIRSAVIGNLLS